MQRLASALLVMAMVLTMLAPVSFASVSYPYLSITLDKTKYTPGDTATATVKIHNYPAGFASVTAEMIYDSTVLGDPTTPPDLSGSLLSQASVIYTNPHPGQFTVNLSQAPTGTATMGAEATLFTLQFPVRTTAPNNYSELQFSPVTGLVDDGVLLLDTNDQSIEDYDNLAAKVHVWMGGTVKGRVTLRDRPAEYQDYSGTVVTVYGSAGPVTATTDSLGDFSISNAAEGLMPVYISRPGYLTAKVSNVPVARGQVTDLTSLGVSLIPGNIIDSTSLDPDTIFLEDLAGLARAIGSTATTTGTTSFQTTWNAAADLDGDLSVGASDLARLAQNWGLSGPGNHYRAPAAGTFFTLPAPVAATTTLTVAASPASVQYSDEVQLQATLRDDAGNPLPYKMIEFHLGGKMKVPATDLNGVASVTMRVQAPVGPATFQAKFLGDKLNASVQQTGSLTVTVEDAELAYTGPGMITTGTYSLGFHLNQANDDSLTQVGPGSVYAEATPLAGINLSVVTGTGTWDIYGDGYVDLTLANVPYSLSLSTTSGSSYSAPAITRTLRTYSTLALSGPASAEPGSTVSFVATLTPAMANKYITFSLDGFSLSQVQTDSTGRATATFTLNNYEGSQSVEAEFFGDPYLAESSALAGVDTTVPVTEPATTTLTLGSMSYSAYVGDPLTITATLASEAGGLGSQGVGFNIYDANTMEWVLSSTGSLTTDSTGLATWVISSVNLAAGTYAVEAAFDGTTEWASSASSKVQLSVQQPAAVSNSIAVRFKIGPDSYTNSVSQGSTLAVVANYTTVATSNFTFAYAPEGDQTYTTLAAGIGTVDGKAVASLDTTALATGTYTFRVSDSEGLSGTATLVVTEPEPTLAATSLQVTNSYSSTVYTDRYEATVQLTSGGTYVSNQPVVFRIFDASGLTELAESEPILTSSTGSATLSILWVASGTGTYSVQAFYAGDTTYAAASSTSTTVFVGLENATLTYTGSLISDSTGSMFVEVGILQAVDGELVGTYPSSGIALKLEIFAPGTTSPLTTLTQPVYSTGYWNSTVSGLTPTSSFDVKVSLEPNSYFTASPISKSGKTATYLEFVSADAGTVYTDRFEATAVLTANQAALSGQPVYFKLNDGSQDPPVFGPVSTSSTGSATLSILWVQTGAGDFTIEAAYPGDTTYASVSTAPLGVTIGVETATLSYTGSLTADTSANLSLAATLTQEADGNLVGLYPADLKVPFDIYAAGTGTWAASASGTVGTDGTVTASASGLTAGGNYDVKVSLPANPYFTASPVTTYYTAASGVQITILAVYEGTIPVTPFGVIGAASFTTTSQVNLY